MNNSFSTQTVLELACATYRINGKYQKESQAIYDNEGKYLYTKFANKTLMLMAVGVDFRPDKYHKSQPPLVKIKGEDRDLANKIKKYYRKLVFSVLAENDLFWTTVNQLLTTDQIAKDSFGFVACLPHLYHKEVVEDSLNALYNSAEDRHLGSIGDTFNDRDCEVIEVRQSASYPELVNVYGIADSCLVWWMSRNPVIAGPCVIVKSKIKDHSTHWKNEKRVTRLNYVVAAQ